MVICLRYICFWVVRRSASIRPMLISVFLPLYSSETAVSDYSFFRTDWISLFARFGYVFHKESASVLFDDTQPNWGGFSSSSDRYGVLHASCRSRILPPGMHHRRLPDRKKSESALQPYCWIRTWRRKGIIKGSTIGSNNQSYFLYINLLMGTSCPLGSRNYTECLVSERLSLRLKCPAMFITVCLFKSLCCKSNTFLQ